MPSVPPNLPPRTRQRLLEAAGEIFAEKGFRQATVRGICARAGANVAAVNYHFRSKEGLYAAVLQYAHGCAAEKYPADVASEAFRRTAPEERLRLFVGSFLRRILDEGRPAWHGKLWAREMVEPTAALDELVARAIRPQSDLLMSIIRDLLGPGASSWRVRACANSVVGQCLYYHFCRPVLARLDPRWNVGPDMIDGIADHVTAFSLEGVRGLAAARPRRRTAR